MTHCFPLFFWLWQWQTCHKAVRHGSDPRGAPWKAPDCPKLFVPLHPWEYAEERDQPRPVPTDQRDHWKPSFHKWNQLASQPNGPAMTNLSMVYAVESNEQFANPSWPRHLLGQANEKVSKSHGQEGPLFWYFRWKLGKNKNWKNKNQKGSSSFFFRFLFFIGTVWVIFSFPSAEGIGGENWPLAGPWGNFPYEIKKIPVS